MKKSLDKLGIEILKQKIKKDDHNLIQLKKKLVNHEILSEDECLILWRAMDAGRLTIPETKATLGAIEKYLKPTTQDQPKSEETDFELLQCVQHELQNIRNGWRVNIFPEQINNVFNNWDDYKKAIESHFTRKKTRRSKILIDSLERTLKNPHFQTKLEVIRSSHNVTTRQFTEDAPTPYELLHEWAIKNDITIAKWDEFHHVIQTELIEHVHYSITESFEIVVLVLFFDIELKALLSENFVVGESTFADIVIQYLLAHSSPNHLIIDIDDSQKIASALLALDYVSTLLYQLTGERNELRKDTRITQLDEPNNPIKAWMLTANRLRENLDIDNNLQEIENMIRSIQGAPNEKLSGDHKLYLEITADTAQANLILMWQRVIAERTKLGQGSIQNNAQSQRLRNSVIAKLVNEGKSDAEVYRAIEDIKVTEDETKEYKDSNLFVFDNNGKLTILERDAIKKTIKRHKKASGI